MMASVNTAFDARLCRTARAWMGWTQEELADRAGVATSTVADFERGARAPIPLVLQKLDEVLGYFRPQGSIPPVEVEWVVNEIAELGVKIGDQFFFCYKGYSLTYTGEDGSDVVLMENSAEPMHWRPIFKREFGECIHPINYADLTKIGTVSLDDSDKWKPLPAAAEINAKLVLSALSTKEG